MAEEKKDLNPATDLICSVCDKQITAGQGYNADGEGNVLHADEDECDK